MKNGGKLEQPVVVQVDTKFRKLKLVVQPGGSGEEPLIILSERGTRTQFSISVGLLFQQLATKAAGKGR